jgi:flagellar biosynthesis protein FlhF
MKTKTYRAPNMLAALQEIQRDLGPNAIVISMREVANGPAWQVWGKPGVEVVATNEMPGKKAEEPKRRAEEESAPGRKEIEALLTALAQRSGAPVVSASQTETKQKQQPVRQHLGTIKEPVKWSPPSLGQKDSTQRAANSTNQAMRVLDDVVDEILEENHISQKSIELIEQVPPLLKLIQHRLLRQGVDQNLVQHLVDTNIQSLSPNVLADEQRLSRYMKKQLEASLHPQKNSMAILQSRVMCLVGATGSGKTSTCAKLAAYYARTLEKKVIWICADTIRAGAISETRTYAESLQIPHYFAYTPQELSELVESQKEADLIIIDTAGVNSLDEDKVLELGTFLNSIPAKSIYVTVPATTKGSDLKQLVSTFSLFNIKGLIATKMDETFSFGEIFNLMLSSHLPVHYFTTGQQVFGKLQQGDPEKLVAAIFGEGI